MSFLLSLFNIFLNCNRKRGIIGTSGADRAQTEECSADAVGMHIMIYIATGDGRGITGK